MLLKLLKYDLKNTSRIFLPVYIFLLIISFAYKLARNIDASYLFNDYLISAASIFIGIIVFLTYGVMAQNFYRDLFGRQGYLINSLPVKSSSIIFSKYITSAFWGILSFNVISFCVFLYYSDVSIEFFLITNYLDMLLFFSIGSLLILFTYTCISISNLFNKNRFIISIFIAIILSIILLIVLNNIYIFLISEFTDTYSKILFIITAWILNLIFFTVTNYIVSKKLNLL